MQLNFPTWTIQGLHSSFYPHIGTSLGSTSFRVIPKFKNRFDNFVCLKILSMHASFIPTKFCDPNTSKSKIIDLKCAGMMVIT